MFTENWTDEYFSVDGSSAFTESQTEEYLTVDGSSAFEVGMKNITSVLITVRSIFTSMLKRRALNYILVEMQFHLSFILHH